jgi:uncharacterized membrane protein YbaN (DUF454 family)
MKLKRAALFCLGWLALITGVVGISRVGLQLHALIAGTFCLPTVSSYLAWIKKRVYQRSCASIQGKRGLHLSKNQILSTRSAFGY